MVDRTEEFWALVNQKPPPLDLKTKLDAFTRECNVVLDQISSLGGSVQRIFADYVDATGMSSMTNSERTSIDAQLQASMLVARKKIMKIKSTFAEEGSVQRHRDNMLEILLFCLQKLAQLTKRKRKMRLDIVVRRLQTNTTAPTLDDGLVQAVEWKKSDDTLAVDVDETTELLAESLAMQENHSSEFDEIRACMKKLEEIGELMTEFTTQIEMQTELVSGIQENAEGSVDEMEQANKYLRRTVESNSTFRWFMIVFFYGTGLFLLFYDWISS